MRAFLSISIALIVLLPFQENTSAQTASQRPNILWLSAEDISPQLGCYGDPHAITPHLDKLATEGVRYTHAFTTAGVCAPCRSGIITGMYQTTLGTHHMRCQANLPPEIRPFPVYLREAGYYTSNNVKEDYQFNTPAETWDQSSAQAHWRGRKNKDQPFFAVFNFTGCHESGITRDEKYQLVTQSLKPHQRQDASKLTTLPPYYPDTQKTREDWKRNYELITAMDAWAGQIISQLKEDGLYDETIIMFWSDHGVGLPRAKRWLYDSGTRVPLIVRIPEKFRKEDQGKPGLVTDELVSSIDFGPTVLNLAGLKLPAHMQGKSFLGAGRSDPRKYVFGARDRMDERYDIIRMVRDKRYKYLRNYEPLKTYYQYMNTSEKGVTMTELRHGHKNGSLSPEADKYFSETKSVEELYDTNSDPHELTNLVRDPKYAEILDRFRQQHLTWVTQTKDLGMIAEPLLAELEVPIGHRYGILRQENGEALAKRLYQASANAVAGVSAIEALIEAMHDQQAVVRYWGAVGIGNIGADAMSAKRHVTELLDDESGAVRIAAARAVCHLGNPELALPILSQELKIGSQWERLQAAIVLDEIGEQATPLIDAMHAALLPKTELFSEGKYTVRVINKALNDLEGTNRIVR